MARTLALLILFQLGGAALAQNCTFGGATLACFEVANDAAVSRNDEIAYSSVPLPRSINLLDVAQLRVTDEQGAEIPAQFAVLARWGGTVDMTTLPVRWLAIAISDQFGPSATQRYSLRREAPAAVPDPLTVVSNGAMHTVDTAAATFVIDETNPALLGQVSVGGEVIYLHGAGAGPLLALGATTLEAGAGIEIDPLSFRVLETGPLRASFAIQGHFVDPAGASLCDAYAPRVPAYEAMGYTVVLTLTRGSGHVDMQFNFRNECLDAMFGPFTDGAQRVERLAWRFPSSLGAAADNHYAGLGGVAATNQAVRVEQRKGGGTPWVRRARVTLDDVESAAMEALTDPIVAVVAGGRAIAASMPWMRFREPQALSADQSVVSLEFLSEPTTVGGGKGLFFPARVSFLDGIAAAQDLEPVRVAARLAMERGLLPRAAREDINRSGIFPSLGTDAPSLLKSEYETYLTNFHDNTVGPNGQHALAKTYGSQLWPDTQGATWPNANNPNGPTDNPGGLNYWSTNRAELLEFLRTGDPLWAWDFALPLTWQQFFSAYVNRGDNADGFKNGLNLTSPTCNGPGGLCEEGQWYRYGGGSDDYGYTWGNLGYVMRPNYPLLRRFAAAGDSVVNRYNIPRAMQGTRESTVSEVDLVRQVIQHFVQLANCAEFVPGAEGLACHNRLIDVVTELAEENMGTGLMCQGDVRPANPSLCQPPGGDPNRPWCDCVTPQQFINNSLIFPFMHRMLLNYGDLGGTLAFGLSMNTWHQYRATIGIPEAQRPDAPTDAARPAIDVTTDWLSQPGWDQDVTPFEVQDVSVIDDDPFTTDPGTIIDENLILEPNKPHSAVQFLLGHSINPDLNLCAVASTALNDQFALDAWDDYENLGGWLKGPAEIMQGMAFGVGIFDICSGLTGGGGDAPQVTITAPANNTTVASGTPVGLQATANDIEDGDLSAAITWQSDLDGAIGTGAMIMPVLSVGSHAVTASARDADLNVGMATVNITVSEGGDCTPGLVLEDDFENGLAGWMAGGLWHRVENSTCGAPGYESPVAAVYFGVDGVCNYDTGQQETGELISPLIRGISADSELRFAEFREVEFEASATVDQTEVAARATGSAQWTTLENRNSQNQSAATWEQHAPLSLAAFAGQEIQIRFLFDSDDEQFNAFTGWMIDDVRVTGCLAEDNQVIHEDGFED